MCSVNQKIVSALKKRMMNSVITNIYHKRDRYDISIITNTEQEYEQSKKESVYIQYSKWSYDKIQYWPTECRYLTNEQRNSRLKSPLNIRNIYIDQFYSKNMNKKKFDKNDGSEGMLSQIGQYLTDKVIGETDKERQLESC